MTTGILIVGTERRAGATTVAAALAAAIRRRGLRAGVLKPVAVGCAPMAHLTGAPPPPGSAPHDDPVALAALERLASIAGPPPAAAIGATPRAALEASEARSLLRAVGSPDPTEDDLDLVSPYRFAAHLEPAPAARAANAAVDLATIAEHYRRIANEHDAVIVDAPAGLMSPINDQSLCIALARDLPRNSPLSVLLVAPSRTGGVIDACLQSIHALRTHDIPFAGVVLDRTTTELSPEEAVNPFQIEQHAGDVVRGILPFLSQENLDDPAQLARRLEVHVDVDAILSS